MASEEGVPGRRAVTILRPGEQFASLFENDLDDAGLSVESARTLEPPLLVLDLVNVRFIGSAFLGRCVLLQKALRARQGELALCGLNRFGSTAFSIAGLDQVIPLFATCEQATASLQCRPAQ